MSKIRKIPHPEEEQAFTFPGKRYSITEMKGYVKSNIVTINIFVNRVRL